MLCENCKEREATVHFTEIMNGTGFYLQVMKSMKTAVWQKQLHTAAGSGWILTICGIRDTPEKAG